MVQTIQAKNITLAELQDSFGLQLTTDLEFFGEWQESRFSLTDEEKRLLQRVKSNYFNLFNRGTILEDAVKMVVLSPLLDLAGLYQSPFAIKTETAIEIVAEDQGVMVRGNIDVLVIQQRFWVLVIESKSTKFDVMEALPQALAYMLSNPKGDQPTFGFLVNGREFVFVKLARGDVPIYSRSYALSIERDNELEQVLSVLKQIGQLIS